MLSLTPVVVTTETEGVVAPSIVRTPIYMQSQGQPIFAWLHGCNTQPNSKQGVIICPPVGYEQIHAHRGLRHLADALAMAGFAVLRLDYHGTGDSAGIDEHPDRHSTWLANIGDAKTWLQRQGCAAISLLGVRLGAALAMQVAAEIDVENLILWAPVVKGRQYVREMKAIGMAAEKKPPVLPNAPDNIEAAGFVITKQTADALASLDLLKIRPRCRNALIVARDDFPEDKRLLEHLVNQNVHATQIVQPGYVEMLVEPHYTKVPYQAISSIVDWLSEQIAKSTGIDQLIMEENLGATSASIAHVTFTANGLSAEHPIIERVLRLSETPDLLGVLSEPEIETRTNRPLILLLNAGAAYHVGPSRFYVLLARQLAAQGFRCLRMDLCGLGDSIANDNERENDPYCETAFRDIELALAYLQSQLPVQQVVLMGLCSGAYLAFQAAAQSQSKILVESVLINPLTYYWRDGMTIGAEPEVDHKSYHYYMQAALQPRKWLKFLSGGTKIGVLGALKLLTQRIRPRRTEARIENAEVGQGPQHPLTENVTADLDSIVQAGRQLTCVFSRSDAGYRLLMYHAKSKVEELKRAGKLKLFFIENADHTFSERVPRLEAVRAICEHLRDRY